MGKTLVRVALCVSVFGLFACGSDDDGSGPPPAPCNERGGECPAGQVCWPNASLSGFECLNAAAGVEAGATCVNSAGSPTCGEGLACVMLMGQTSGTCMTYCDPSIAGKGCNAGRPARSSSSPTSVAPMFASGPLPSRTQEPEAAGMRSTLCERFAQCDQFAHTLRSNRSQSSDGVGRPFVRKWRYLHDLCRPFGCADGTNFTARNLLSVPATRMGIILEGSS